MNFQKNITKKKSKNTLIYNIYLYNTTILKIEYYKVKNKYFKKNKTFQRTQKKM